MRYKERLNGVREAALRVPYGDKSRLVFFSDCHRNDGSEADQFSRNRSNFTAALDYYYRNGFAYVELGDGDELWAGKDMRRIISLQFDIFALMRRFYDENRLLMIYGNHDIVKRSPKWTDLFFRGSNEHCGSRGEWAPFPGIKMHEGIVLRREGGGEEILLLHGHQADFLNDKLWRLSRFLVRHVWRPLEMIGIKNPTSASLNDKKTDKVERILMDYCKRESLMMIAGHTHKPMFPCPGETMYFNDGSCVFPHYVTAIELEEGHLSLVRWITTVRDGGDLHVRRDVMAGPHRVSDYYERAAVREAGGVLSTQRQNY